MKDVYISGSAMTHFGRLDESLMELAESASRAAIEDAGLTPDQIDSLSFGNFLGRNFEHQGVMASILARRLGLSNVPTTNVEGACASAGIALRHGALTVAAGAGRAALCVGAERMTHTPTDGVTAGLAEAGDTLTDGATGLTFPGFFGLVARAHGAEYGTRREHLSAVTVKNRKHASTNPLAMFNRPITADDVASSRAIADPLQLLDCSPISDGAAAAVVVGSDLASASRGGAVRLRSATQTSGPVAINQMTSLTSFPATVAAAAAAYAEAGIIAADIDVVELHDCFSITELVNTADLGFFARGDVADAILEGATGFDTRGLVVNPGGGLLGRGHPVGATGLSQVYEIVSQLRGTAANQVEGARIGMAHNLGGAGATCTITILEGV